MIIVLNNDQFGKNVEYLRKKHGISRTQLAKKLGICVTHLFCIEKGNIREIDYALMTAISQILETDMETLVHTVLLTKK